MTSGTPLANPSAEPENPRVRQELSGLAGAGMLGEAGMCLAFDVPADKPGGFWTPASLLDGDLLERLTEKAGLTFEVVETR